MEQDRSRIKKLRKLIFLVGFTGIMLIGSTYAWFSAQRNVSISNLEGIVNVVEGLEISLDAEHWTQAIDLELAQSSNSGYFGKRADGSEYTLEEPYAGGKNILPSEMIPVSTTGGTGEGIDKNKLQMYRGINVNGINLYNIELADETVENVIDNQFPGYYAIDFFLKNTSAEGITEDQLKLNLNSELSLLSSSLNSTGLQNTVRVGFALYNTTKTNANDVDIVNGTKDTIITATAGESQTIKDVAIWEPNAEAHVDYIVTNNNRITWNETAGDALKYLGNASSTKFTSTQKIPTYGLTVGSTTALANIKVDTSTTVSTGISDIYDWSDAGIAVSKLKKQETIQTNTGALGEVTDLMSVQTTEETPKGFAIPANEICRIRMYVWLEGQDVDCTNLASHGGGISLNLGILKGEGEENPTTGGPYIPSGFSEVAGTSLATGYTIQDSTGNQYVWIEVPQTDEVYPNAGLDITAFTDDEYTAIENDLHTYTSVYRNGTSYTDTYSGNDASTGLTSTQYTELKQKMLKSVYQNGGFYVGKYEAGIMDSYRDYGEEYDIVHPIAETAVVQENAYPYNWVTCSQAQSLASGMESGEYTSSLMFGVQWDLMLKYLETKGATVEELNEDSTSWGNVYNNTYTISNANVKYNVVDQNTWLITEWLSATSYTHNNGDATILTTGASSQFSKQNIYNIAGNMAEWTLEYTSDTGLPCAGRGGSCDSDGYDSPASCRDLSTTYSNPVIGFRPSLY